uniref:Putative secreted protein n=1 Tax=Anopheles darlingi TaxID=43151 RepID=A0A2M4DL43_ANODA
MGWWLISFNFDVAFIAIVSSGRVRFIGGTHIVHNGSPHHIRKAVRRGVRTTKQQLLVLFVRLFSLRKAVSFRRVAIRLAWTG